MTQTMKCSKDINSLNAFCCRENVDSYFDRGMMRLPPPIAARHHQHPPQPQVHHHHIRHLPQPSPPQPTTTSSTSSSPLHLYAENGDEPKDLNEIRKVSSSPLSTPIPASPFPLYAIQALRQQQQQQQPNAASIHFWAQWLQLQQQLQSALLMQMRDKASSLFLVPKQAAEESPSETSSIRPPSPGKKERFSPYPSPASLIRQRSPNNNMKSHAEEESEEEPKLHE